MAGGKLRHIALIGINSGPAKKAVTCVDITTVHQSVNIYHYAFESRDAPV